MIYDMNVPERCKDCAFLRYVVTANNKSVPKCMLSHPFNLASGCPNKRKEMYHVYDY